MAAPPTTATGQGEQYRHQCGYRWRLDTSASQIRAEGWSRRWECRKWDISQKLFIALVVGGRGGGGYSCNESHPDPTDGLKVTDGYPSIQDTV